MRAVVQLTVSLTVLSCAQPLPSGLVLPDRALLLSSFLYITVLSAACMMVSRDHAVEEVQFIAQVKKQVTGLTIVWCAGVDGPPDHHCSVSSFDAAVHAALEALVCHQECVCRRRDRRIACGRCNCCRSGAL